MEFCTNQQEVQPLPWQIARGNPQANAREQLFCKTFVDEPIRFWTKTT